MMEREAQDAQDVKYFPQFSDICVHRDATTSSDSGAVGFQIVKLLVFEQ
jgi:hypothetical protein